MFKPYVAAFCVCIATPLWRGMGHPCGVTWDARYHRTAQKRPWSQLALPARTKQARASATESCLTGPQQWQHWQAINHSIKLSSSTALNSLPRLHKHNYRIQNLGHSLRIGSQPRATVGPNIQYQPLYARPRPRRQNDPGTHQHGPTVTIPPSPQPSKRHALAARTDAGHDPDSCARRTPFLPRASVTSLPRVRQGWAPPKGDGSVAATPTTGD